MPMRDHKTRAILILPEGVCKAPFLRKSHRLCKVLWFHGLSPADLSELVPFGVLLPWTCQKQSSPRIMTGFQSIEMSSPGANSRPREQTPQYNMDSRQNPSPNALLRRYHPQVHMNSPGHSRQPYGEGTFCELTSNSMVILYCILFRQSIL